MIFASFSSGSLVGLWGQRCISRSDMGQPWPPHRDYAWLPTGSLASEGGITHEEMGQGGEKGRWPDVTPQAAHQEDKSRLVYS